MGWLGSFLLGRPGYEMAFDVNPMALSIDDGAKAVYHETINGDLKKSVRKVMCPTVKLSSDYLTKTQRDILSSMASYPDTFLSFQMRNDFRTVLQVCANTDASTVALPNSSVLRLANIFDVRFGTGNFIIDPNTDAQVYAYNDPGGAGTNYNASPSLPIFNGVINLTSPLPGDAQGFCFVNYTYKGWLVDLQKFSHSSKAGWLDRFNYDFVLTPA